jgi:hypothetical protein
MALLLGLVLVSCSDSVGPEPPLDCSDASTEVLGVGEHRILDYSEQGACVRLPAAGPGGAEHLYIALATAGEEAPNGVSSPYLLSGVSAAAAVALPALPAPVLSAFQRPLRPQTFHRVLRARERALAEDVSGVLFNRGRVDVAEASPRVLGEQRSFNVCSSSECDAFVQTTATARSIGERVAIYVDNSAPLGGYTDPDLDRVRTLFDQHLYRIDTTAFGRESDIDGNGVVVVLLTQLVNALSQNCAAGEIVLGYFFGADLLPPSSSNPGSNQGEVFFGLVPDPNNPDCAISTAEANSYLPSTFIHEFQHMISFNQHVLVRRGRVEDTWLNEGLSHFAEELGGRLVPDTECPTSGSCAQDFLSGDLLNAFAYLRSPEGFYLIPPTDNVSPQLEERGAEWLFVRWLVDNFASTPTLGTDLTKALLATNQVGSANVAARTGVDFSTLVGEWQLTNYLDDLPGFSAPASRLTYTSWNFRLAADTNEQAFPLVPDNTSGSAYGHTGTLRAGSGQHVLITQAASAPGVDLRLTNTTGGALPSSIEPRIALVRIR